MIKYLKLLMDYSEARQYLPREHASEVVRPVRCKNYKNDEHFILK